MTNRATTRVTTKVMRKKTNPSKSLPRMISRLPFPIFYSFVVSPPKKYHIIQKKMNSKMHIRICCCKNVETTRPRQDPPPLRIGKSPKDGTKKYTTMVHKETGAPALI